MQTASTLGTSISSTPGRPSSPQPRQNRGRILHMLERVIHRHDVEAAGRECRILHEAGRDGNPERLARMARVLLVGFETARHRSRASAARRPPRRRRRRRREYDRRALYKVRARDSDSARRGPTWRYGASTAWSAPCSRAGIRSNSNAALLLPMASDSTTRGRICGKSSCAAGARRDRDRRSPRHRTRRRDCRGPGTQSRLETRTNCGSSDPSRKFFGLRSNIC